jgi:hypothetical protein
MLAKAALATVIATIWSPAICDEVRSYTVTVVEPIRHEITVEAAEEYAARSDALLEARRTSGSLYRDRHQACACHAVALSRSDPS